MVGGNAKPEEAIGNRKPVNNVDADLVHESLLTVLLRVIARRSRSDHRHMPHEPLPPVSCDASADWARCKANADTPIACCYRDAMSVIDSYRSFSIYAHLEPETLQPQE